MKIKILVYGSFGGENGKFYDDDCHLHLDGSNFEDLKLSLSKYYRKDIPWDPVSEIESFWALNKWDVNEDEAFKMYLCVDCTGWNGCASAFDSFDKVFDGCHYTQPIDLLIPASVVRNTINTNKVVDIIVPWCKYLNRDNDNEVKNFTCEVHMIDDYNQLPNSI